MYAKIKIFIIQNKLILLFFRNHKYCDIPNTFIHYTTFFLHQFAPMIRNTSVFFGINYALSIFCSLTSASQIQSVINFIIILLHLHNNLISDNMNYTLIITLSIVVLFVIVFTLIFNKLVKLKNLMQEAWSIIDVCLKKRCDLVPNLVETVKGYAAHERSTLEELTRFRSEAMQANDRSNRMDLENKLGKSLKQLFVVVENYPALKANTNFLELQRQLADIENELAMARRYYNGTVRENNIYIERFPSNLIAGMFSFAKGKFFTADENEKIVPDVSFQ